MYYLNEHVSCKYYSTTVQNGFVNYSMVAGECICREKTQSDNLVFVCSGTFLLSLEHAPDTEFKAGDLFYVQGGVHIVCKAETDIQVLILSCATCDLYERLAEDRPESIHAVSRMKSCCGLIAYKQNPHIRKFVASMWAYLTEGMKCKHLQEAKMKEILILLNLCYTETELHRLFHPVISSCENIQFRSQVLRHADEARNAAELAERCGYGIRQFERKFKEIFENSPYQWMLEQKKQNLLDKLLDKELPIKHIVIDFEFCSASHLNVFCKRYYGETAAEIRKKITV